MNVSRPMRTVRAAVFAALCVAVSAVGHVWMSGRPVPPWALALAALLVFGAALAGAGRRRGFGAIAALMLAGELGLHALFSAAQRVADAGVSSAAGMAMPAGTSPPNPAMAMAGPASGAMSMPGMVAGGAQATASSMPGMPGMPDTAAMPGASSGGFSPGAWLMRVAMSHGPLGMVAVHAAAGLACAWWLYAGERAVFGVLQWMLALTAPAFALAEDEEPVFVPVAPRPAAVSWYAPSSGYPEPLVHVLVRRGPPPRPVGF